MSSIRPSQSTDHRNYGSSSTRSIWNNCAATACMAFKRSINQNYFNFVPHTLRDPQILALAVGGLRTRRSRLCD